MIRAKGSFPFPRVHSLNLLRLTRCLSAREPKLTSVTAVSPSKLFLHFGVPKSHLLSKGKRKKRGATLAESPSYTCNQQMKTDGEVRAIPLQVDFRYPDVAFHWAARRMESPVA